MKPFLLFTIAVLLVANTAQAVVFRRDILTIHPQPIGEENQTKDATGTDKKTNTNNTNRTPQPPREPIRFYTEIRNEQALELDWVHSLNRINAERTMTIIFDPPRYDLITPQQVRQPLDILSIDRYGRIVQIIPDLTLEQLAAPLETSQPVRARLIVQGGAAKQLGLKPGDRVEHPYFSPPPTVLTE